MNLFKNTLYCLVFILFISSCRRDGFLVSENGLQYHIVTKLDGKKPKVGDIMKMHLIYKNRKDSVLYDSKILGDSFLIELTPPTFKGGIEEGFAMLGEGDSALFLAPADSIFDKLFRQPLPNYIKKGEKLKFEVKLINVISKQDFLVQLKKNRLASSDENKLQIENFLAHNNLQVKPVSKGFYFVALKDGIGELPKVGDVIVLNFIGKTLEGQIFESSKSIKKEFVFELGSHEVPDIFNIAVANMKEDGFYRIVLDANRSKGMFGVEKLPSIRPVVYDFEVLKIKRQNKSS